MVRSSIYILSEDRQQTVMYGITAYPIDRAVYSVEVWKCMIAEIAGSNPAKGMDVLILFVVCCVGSVLETSL